MNTTKQTVLMPNHLALVMLLAKHELSITINGFGLQVEVPDYGLLCGLEYREDKTYTGWTFLNWGPPINVGMTLQEAYNWVILVLRANAEDVSQRVARLRQELDQLEFSYDALTRSRTPGDMMDFGRVADATNHRKYDPNRSTKLPLP